MFQNNVFLMKVLPFVLLFSLPFFCVKAQNPGLDQFFEGEKLKEAGSYREAVKAYEKAIEKEPENLEYKVTKCQCYLNLMEFKEAVNCFGKISEDHPENADVYEALGNLYAQAGAVDLAVDNYGAAAKYSKDNDQKLLYDLNIISMLFENDKLSQAGEYISAAGELFPEHFDIMYYKGAYLNAVGKHKEALETMKKVVGQLNTDTEYEGFAKYYYELGKAYYKMGEYERAADVLPKADYEPYKRRVYYMQSEFLMKKAEALSKLLFYKEALNITNLVLRMNSEHQKAIELKTNLISKKKADRAKIISEIEKSIDPDGDRIKQAEKHSKLAVMNFEEGNFEKAANHGEQYLFVKPKNLKMNYLVSIAQFNNGNSDSALETLKVLTRIPQSDAQLKANSFFAMGLIYKKENRLKDAYIAFKKSSYSRLGEVAASEIQEVKEALSISTNAKEGE